MSRPTTPNTQRHQAIPRTRFRLFPFRSPLLRESLLLFFPRGTEMFQFPRFPPPALCIQTGVTWVSMPGFPIRTSADHRLFDSFPRLIAANRVLHRCQVPRHPPLALHSLEEQRCSCSLCNSQRARSGRHASGALPGQGEAPGCP
jgi:hypothetical protein